ncbi:MAG: beta-N-acetylhexosaminidase [Alphaproteobacteria bacterium]|nr:MAG: beta-N-acetylhexosaminidase [Alphaproteobacteria bacterium]
MPRPIIVDCTGPVLDPEERALFRALDPLGFILFARHVETPDQVRRLVDDLRHSVGRLDAPVLIDQEGGRVCRLKPPHWRAVPPAADFGALAAGSLELGKRAAWLNSRLVAVELADLGISVDCLPVLDLRLEGAHDIIGDRSYGSDPDLVAVLGRAAAEGLMAGGVLPVVKHIPGHGRAGQDSHLALPVVDAHRQTLAATDFAPFRALCDLPLAMTAHITYLSLDPDAPATLSRKVIDEVIRGDIGFQGMLISDDLTMKALTGALPDLAIAALAAGCDAALLCNASLEDRRAVLEAVEPLGGAASARVRAAFAPPEADPFDAQAGLMELEELLAQLKA